MAPLHFSPELRQSMISYYAAAFGIDHDRAAAVVDDIEHRGTESAYEQLASQFLDALAPLAHWVNTEEGQRVLAEQHRISEGEADLVRNGCRCVCRMMHDPEHPGMCVGKRAITTISMDSPYLGRVDIPLCGDCAYARRHQRQHFGVGR